MIEDWDAMRRVLLNLPDGCKNADVQRVLRHNLNAWHNGQGVKAKIETLLHEIIMLRGEVEELSERLPEEPEEDGDGNVGDVQDR
jgi:hypothetical protein